jgi:hypothetical protein
MIDTKEKKQSVVIKLIKLPALDNKGKEMKDKGGDIVYKQEDAPTLLQLLNRYDNSKHPGSFKEFKSIIAIKDKVERVMIDDKEELELSVSDAGWLKKYLEGLPDNECKREETALRPYEIRTLVSITEQLD